MGVSAALSFIRAVAGMGLPSGAEGGRGFPDEAHKVSAYHFYGCRFSPYGRKTATIKHKILAAAG